MSRRDQIRMTDAETEAFLHDGRKVLNVATYNHDGSIHLVAMWFCFLNDQLAYWTYAKSQKVMNIRRDPRTTCLVETGDSYDQLQGVELVGRARVVDDRETVMEIGSILFERYTAPLTADARPIIERTGAKRVGVLVDVERVVSWDHRKLGGTY